MIREGVNSSINKSGKEKMNMKKKLSLIAAAALVVVSLTGCGIVKVVPIGQQDKRMNGIRL